MLLPRLAVPHATASTPPPQARRNDGMRPSSNTPWISSIDIVSHDFPTVSSNIGSRTSSNHLVSI